MIISGGSRRGATWFAGHLMRTDQDQSVRLAETRGLAGYDIPGWFRQMEAVSFGTRCENYFYHANINPREDESLTEAQWTEATDRLEHNLGLDGHSRFVVEHEKDGRTHRHVFWSRIDPDTMTAVSDSKTYRIHERTADELEKTFGHEPTPRGRGPDGRRPDNWEVFRGKESGIDPQQVKAELTQLWRQCDTGQAFAAALAEHGYILAKGDRRDFVVIDPNGDDHSLARRISGAKAADIRARMADVDRDALPSVQEARKLARERKDDAADAPSPDASQHAHKHDASLFAEIAEELIHAVKDHRKDAEEKSPDPPAEAPNEPSPFERVASELAQAARDAPALEELAVAAQSNPTEFERVASEAKAALREGGGEGFMFAAGLAWIARKLKQRFTDAPPDRERTPFEQVAEETKQAARENGGEPYSPDGESFWRRGVAMVADAYDRTTSWVRETAQDFVGRLLKNRNSDHDDPGMER